MKKSFTLLEVIFVLLLTSIIISATVLFIKNMKENNKHNLQRRVIDLDLLSTFIFIQNNIKKVKDLKYENKNLYFQNKLLLENISSFSIVKNKKIYFLNICIKEICKKDFLNE